MNAQCALVQAVAEMMREELEGNYLEVVLIPSEIQHWPTERMRRVVVWRNCDWYRRFCDDYVSGRRPVRRRRKHDTLIKRQSTIKALLEIENGRCDTVYAHRLLPYVLEEVKRLQAEQHAAPVISDAGVYGYV